MNIFARPGNPVIYNFHSYVAESAPLQNIGLGSYTRNSMNVFGQEKNGNTTRISPEINEYFGGSFNAVKPRLLGDQGTIGIIKYDKDNNQYSYITDNEIFNTPDGSAATSLSDFQEKFDSWQRGFLTNEEEISRIQYVWSTIQNSSSGCIHFMQKIKILDCDDIDVSIRLYFHSSGKAKSGRGVALKGSPIIAAVPRTATGFAYSYAETQKTGPGIYVPQLAGGINNADNTVAGELRVVYDPATGKFQSGTQQALFRLLTDIPGVPEKDMPSNIDSIDHARFFTGNLSIEPNVGSGMPLSIENNNPMMFGPHSIGCGGPKEKVLMVNRTPRNFAAGEIVIGSLIDGEWIPMAFGLPSLAPKQFGIEWSQIQKYIVDAKSFFRNDIDTTGITPSRYIDHVRYRFYSSLPSKSDAGMLSTYGNDLTRIALLNLLNPDDDLISQFEIDRNGKIILPFNTIAEASQILYPNYQETMNLIPSTGYLTFFDADMLHDKLGGNNSQNILKLTNISQIPFDDPSENEIYASTVHSSWGLYFPDGYSSASVAGLKRYNGKSVVHVTPQSIYKDSTLDLGTVANDPLNISDPYFYHFPAQFALNSSGNQTLYPPYLWSAQEFGRALNYADKMIEYMKSSIKGDYLSASGKNVYNLKPLNPNKVQFTPLSLGLALCSTKSFAQASANTGSVNGGLRELKNHLEQAFQGLITGRDKDNFGEAFTRLGCQEQTFSFFSDNDVKGYVGFGKNCIDYKTKRPSRPNRNDLTIDGGPGILPTEVTPPAAERSNVVGIIAARASVSLANGGQLELRTNNNFGLNTYRSGGTTGGDVSITVLPLLGGAASWSTDTRGESRPLDNVQWGSSSQAGDITAFGTTALYCQIYDHCPNTVYDGRFLVPLQFHGNKVGLDNKNIEIDVPAYKSTNGNPTLFPLGTVIGKDYLKNNKISIINIKNPIRKNMLLTGGGFCYFREVFGANPEAVRIIKPGKNYAEGDTITFGGTYPASGMVTTTNADGGITGWRWMTDEIGINAYGEFNLLNGNPFEKDPINGTVSHIASNQDIDPENEAEIVLDSCKLMQKIVRDNINSYNRSLLTPYDNNGGGDGRGWVTSSKSTSYNLEQNLNGKYDILFFFVNDILNYPDNVAGFRYEPLYANAQYVNLEISAN